MHKTPLLSFLVVVVGCHHSKGSVDDAPPHIPCSGLDPICGPTGTSPCCSSQIIPGGTFYRSYDASGDAMYSGSGYPAVLSDFRLDVYEVTVGRFRQFVNAGQGTQTNEPLPGAGARTFSGIANEGGWDPTWNTNLAADTGTLIAALKCNVPSNSWTDTPAGNEALPINCLSWYEAMAFCVWDGGFLPTEAEWNYAAAGGAEQRAYPWSAPASSLTIDCAHANYYDGIAYCVPPQNGRVNRVGSESPVGDGNWGLADLGGNVSEWTLDWVWTLYFSLPCNDCTMLSGAISGQGESPGRAVRGGAFDGVATLLRTGNRQYGWPAGRSAGIGVRCARAP